MTRDVTEFLANYDMGPPKRWSSLRVAYHSACSMQHGQRVIDEPRKLLRNAGFSVVEVPEGHLCCGSAGTYNILQPDIAARAARPQGRKHQERARRRGRDRQYRLHHAARRRHGHSHRAHRRAARLGLWRPGAARTGGAVAGTCTTCPRPQVRLVAAQPEFDGFRSDPATSRQVLAARCSRRNILPLARSMRCRHAARKSLL